MIKNISLLLALIFTSQIALLAQDHESVLNAPDNWVSEIIPFPIDFAPEIDFVGIEELRFAPGWSDSTSQEFWSYMFVWHIDEYGPMNTEKLTTYFQSYYDGLMDIDIRNSWDHEGAEILEKAHCSFKATTDGFAGEMYLYDAFFKHEYFRLYIHVTDSICPKTKKQVITCEVSPHPFDHPVWAIFEAVTLKENCD